MLQFITQSEEKFSVVEQCQMAIEGGSGWIQLHIPDKSEAEIREIAELLIPLCRETGTILTIEDNPVLTKELGVHGVHLSLDSGLKASAIREEFGPEAIIGQDVTDPETILSMKDADIDYVTIPAYIDKEERVRICDTAATGGNIIPVVFSGDFAADSVSGIFKEGASGICTGRYIVDADDPVAYTALVIKNLKEAER